MSIFMCPFEIEDVAVVEADTPEEAKELARSQAIDLLSNISKYDINIIQAQADYIRYNSRFWL